ncbi:MAG: sulfatase-like hydrolase/transferase [Planctomycetaceae bacterium]|nr:sulfatase-like hydrolase/transferase [Planctomycetaceae bacterium]
MAAERPNFVFILADDVGQECLRCYGGESYPTPNLDRLAKTGMRFEHCYSMPACHPTRLAIMTGQYPFRNPDAKWGTFPTEREAFTFSSILRDDGYATGVFGKWQLELLKENPDHAYRLGFDHSDLFGWHEGPRYYEPMIYQNGVVREDTLGHYGPDLYLHSLIEFMKQNKDQPFLAYYPMALCHDVTDDLDASVPHGPLGRYDSYPEMIAEMDRNIGRIVAALEALKLRENTVILFVGDNGTPQRMILRAEGKKLIRVPVVSLQNGEEIPGGKTTLLDTGTHVPLIANWPGTINAGQVVDDLVDMSDFWPTLLELAGVEKPQNYSIDGISFAKRLTNGEPTARTWAYCEKGNRYWVRNQKWKLYNDGRLYDMEQDKWETSPIKEGEDTAGAKSMRQTLRAEMERKLAR